MPAINQNARFNPKKSGGFSVRPTSKITQWEIFCAVVPLRKEKHQGGQNHDGKGGNLMVAGEL